MTTTKIGAGTTVAAGYTIASAGVTLNNYGVVGSTAGAAHIGVYFAVNGYVINQIGGTIVSNGFAGIKAKVGVSPTVYNYGLISGGTYGVNLRGGGNLANKTGEITASSGPGVYLSQSGTVFNGGSIYAAATGVDLKSGGTVVNGGSITVSKDAAVYLGAAGSVINAGFIQGATSGIRMFLGGYVHNYAGAQIVGNGPNGVLFNAAGTLVDAGYIHGVGGTAVGFAAGFNNYLMLQPGASFGGIVNGGNTVGAADTSSMVLLASKTTTGTISGLGTEYINFADITVATGASWQLNGANSIATAPNPASFYDNGTLINSGSFNGYIQVNSGGAFTNQSGATITGAVLDAGRMINVGHIYGRIAGVELTSTNALTNQSGGTIVGVQEAMLASAAGTVVNGGSIYSPQAGILFDSGGGSVTNQAGGSIVGILAIDGALTVMNAGYIGGQIALQNIAATKAVIDPAGTINGDVIGGYGNGFNSTLVMASGTTIGTITGIGSQFTDFNQITVNANANWVLSGANSIAQICTLTSSGTLTDRGSLTNAGLITSNGIAVVGGTAATIVNKVFATIHGASEGISFKAAGTVFNSWAIYGSGPSGTAVSFPSGFTNLMVLYPGQRFIGTVNGGNAIGGSSVSTLELASSPSYGQIGGIGSQYVDFAQVTIELGGRWLLTGTDNIAAGAVLSDGGALYNSGAVTGNVTIDQGASFTNNSGATIAGAVYGLAGTPPSVTNSGKIDGGTYGVNLRGGGTVTNQSGGVLAPTALGIYAVASSTVVNSGGVTAGIGVKLHAGGSVTNLSGGSITGASGGAILMMGLGTVVNAGSLQGGLAANPATGISLAAGGMVTNQSGRPDQRVRRRSAARRCRRHGRERRSDHRRQRHGGFVPLRCHQPPRNESRRYPHRHREWRQSDWRQQCQHAGADRRHVNRHDHRHRLEVYRLRPGRGRLRRDMGHGGHEYPRPGCDAEQQRLTDRGRHADRQWGRDKQRPVQWRIDPGLGRRGDQPVERDDRRCGGGSDGRRHRHRGQRRENQRLGGRRLCAEWIGHQSIRRPDQRRTYGVQVYSASIFNAGSIQGGSSAGQTGVLLKHGGSLTNQSGGTIAAAFSGVRALAGTPATVVNFGFVEGATGLGSGGTGVVLRRGLGHQ